jgi:hypothetical protein
MHDTSPPLAGDKGGGKRKKLQNSSAKKIKETSKQHYISNKNVSLHL